ncbi:MAG: ABC-2 transporter permease [Candidatus Latescibacterota bacterium]|jgi:ABC-type transport system involved in multi-copper enzyme maturation permease subunit
MLRNLLRKDLLMNRWLIGMMLFYVLLGAWSVSRPGYAFVAGLWAAIGVLIGVSIAGREDKVGASALVASLPLTRRDLVLSRYVGSVIGAGAFYLAVALVALTWPQSTADPIDLLGPAPLLAAAGGVALTAALLLPLTFRFGFLGLLAMIVASQVLLLVALGLATLLDATGTFAWSLEALIRAPAALRHLAGGPIAGLGAGAGMAALLWLSFRLSVFLAERRDL